MILSSPRKRSRDVEDDFDLTTQPLGKKSRSVVAADSPLSHSTSRGGQWQFLQSPLQSSDVSEDDSINSNVSEAGSALDDGMELDATAISPITSQPRSWSSGQLTPTISRPSWGDSFASSSDQQTPRRAQSTRLLIRPVRPKVTPLQSASSAFRSSSAHRFFPINATNIAATDRLTSPFDEDEPHTPTTIAGSQFSNLSVTDMDIDSASPPAAATPSQNRYSSPFTPRHFQSSTNYQHNGHLPTSSSSGNLSTADDDFEGQRGRAPEVLGVGSGSGLGAGATIRRQRQRSGAFISSPDVAKRFQMGYREDCERCRERVPGHMNHFLES